MSHSPGGLGLFARIDLLPAQGRPTPFLQVLRGRTERPKRDPKDEPSVRGLRGRRRPFAIRPLGRGSFRGRPRTLHPGHDPRRRGARRAGGPDAAPAKRPPTPPLNSEPQAPWPSPRHRAPSHPRSLGSSGTSALRASGSCGGRHGGAEKTSRGGTSLPPRQWTSRLFSSSSAKNKSVTLGRSRKSQPTRERDWSGTFLFRHATEGCTVP